MIILNILAPLFLLFSGLPQLIKLLKTKSGKDISLATYLMTLFAIIILLQNSIITGNKTLITSNFVSCFFLTINSFLIMKYRFDENINQ